MLYNYGIQGPEGGPLNGIWLVSELQVFELHKVFHDL